ncbi:MAG: zinc-ribbon domain-containing protein [Polyangiaceae bacterium]|nr:zinc-ribbon domain-containing protein [Polyangiaceae bacterium]
MKFLCPNCNAKYQISEEKVAGRSVKIHCRNCGFVIRIAQPSVTALTSHLASLRPPAPDAAPPAPDPARPSPREPRLRRPVPSASAERAGGTESRGRLDTQAAPARRPARTAGPPPAASGSRIGAAGPAVAASAGAGRVDASPSGSEERARELLRQATAHRESGRPSKQRSDPPGALAGAFARAVDHVASGAAEEMVSGDEWWVGIQDVPTGPLRLSDLRTKAAQGVVGPDSLVWREGFADWAPLKKYPELLAVIEEATSRTDSSPQIVPGPTALQVSAAAGVALGDPFKNGPAEASLAVDGPRAAAAAALDVDGAIEQIAGLSKAPRVPAAAWLAVGVALICGFTGGFVVFSGGPSATSTNPSQAAVLAATPAVSGAAQATLAKAPESPAAETPASPKGSGAKSTHSTVTRNTSSSAQAHSSPGQGLTGLRGLSAGRSSGPSSSLDGRGAGSSSGQGLDADTLQKTVSRYKGSVNRSCWQPALDTRDTNAPTTARVSVTLVVSPNGQVASATTGGDPVGYRGLARCIEARVRGWQFPASRGSTTVNVPFVFAAQ